MSRIIKTALTLGLFLAALGLTFGDDAKKPIGMNEKVEMKASVVAVDKTNRILTLKGEKSAAMTYYIDESVGDRFDKVKVGDKITVKYYDSVAFELKKPDEAGVAVPGAKPATAPVTVMAIDQDTPSITVKAADGTVITRRVRNKNNLQNVQVGDTIIIVKTEPLVVDLT
ncbi:MAG TPA: hypothetical protein VFW45_05305 [Candidatus Polarisedimenticolia bacterium]|nr:hypothetical protein [Candidatus Polarisedimenticolia bacterium]